jgi:hypothetical protein
VEKTKKKERNKDMSRSTQIFENVGKTIRIKTENADWKA